LRQDAAKLSYRIIQDLIYYKDIEQNYWLCILSFFHQKVFFLMHDFMSHSKYVKIHEKLTEELYIYNLLKYLHNYIHHCLQYQVIQMSHHKLYKSLQSILTSLWSFHTITVNFILALSETSESYKSIILIIDKISKAVSFISEKKIITEEDWAISLMNWLTFLN